MKKLIFTFLIFSINLFAEDIYLKNGTVFYNAKIVEENAEYITITMNGGKSNISLDSILKIVRTPYDPNKASYVNFDNLKIEEPKKIEEPNKIVIHQKQYLVVTVLAAFLAWDYFSDASKLPKGEIKTRKTVLGVVSAVGCIAALYFSFKEVEIKANPNKVTVSYNF